MLRRSEICSARISRRKGAENNDVIDDPLFKEYNHIVDDLATIDVNAITTVNTLSLQAEHTLVDEYGMPVSTYMQDMSSLTHSEFAKKKEVETWIAGGVTGSALDRAIAQSENGVGI